jgi:hypothetical protein
MPTTTPFEAGWQPQAQLGDGFFPTIPKAYGFEAATPRPGEIYLASFELLSGIPFIRDVPPFTSLRQ